jgi:hypothetical protein
VESIKAPGAHERGGARVIPGKPPEGIRGSTRVTDDPELRLEQMVASLKRQRRALALAREFNRPVLAADRHRIQKLQEAIRAHCAEHGLERPAEVPETD